jgi:hypothetical protein
VCYSCTNGVQTINKEINIRQKINCAIALSNATTTIKSYADPASGTQLAAVTYSASTQWLDTIYTGPTTYFSNAYSADCGAITTCSLYESDCSTAHSTKARIDASTFALQVT